MASKTMFQPLILKGGEDFENWERKIKITQCCADIKVETLHSDSGADELIKKLKTIYDKDAEQAAFIAYEELETFQRPPSISILDYINELERRNNKIKSKKRLLCPYCLEHLSTIYSCPALPITVAASQSSAFDN